MRNLSDRDACFIDLEGRLRVVARPAALALMLGCTVESRELETGGILIGKYCEDHCIAVIEEATPVPPDSTRNGSSFVRGTSGLRSRLREAWQRGSYYLGEWHSHPKSKPLPSDTDKATLASIASNPNMHCTNPVLFIIGGEERMHVSTWHAGVLKRRCDEDKRENGTDKS